MSREWKKTALIELEATEKRPNLSEGNLRSADFLFICVYLEPEAGGYSRRANLASQAAGRHTHPGCAVDLEESGAPSQHPHALPELYQQVCMGG